MKTLSRKNIIVGAILLTILISIPLTVSLLSKQQQSQSHASASTSLSLMPASSPTAPIQTSIGSTVDLDLYVDPGTNAVTFVRYQITYDPTKIQIVAAHPIDLNNTVFTNVEGPVSSNSGTISQSVSIGSDPTKVVTKRTKIGTLHFIAIGGTNGGITTVSFGTISQALSSGATDQASQNVLSTVIPAILTISGTGSPNPTILPLPTVTGTALNFSLFLHGVGSAGDNPNPSGNSLSNKNPLHPQRALNVTVFNTSNQIVASSSSPVVFDSGTGTFIGAVGLPQSVQSGNYSIKIQTDRYLRKLVPGIQQIVSGQMTQVTPVQMIAGDTNNDNVLNILDYNALLDCGYGQLNPLPMNDPNSTFHSAACQVHTPSEDVDINDDGIINSIDYNLFLRELSVQNGD
ncbi:MAG TPA: hypothetical protein VNW29_01805 [Candidatus Sulfotelmatobacter sp.]|nr:hypothetical protein [Candidatus Sulfotelmatobacter sp.]